LRNSAIFGSLSWYGALSRNDSLKQVGALPFNGSLALVGALNHVARSALLDVGALITLGSF
jgi:hypothetical protein